MAALVKDITRDNVSEGRKKKLTQMLNVMVQRHIATLPLCIHGPGGRSGAYLLLAAYLFSFRVLFDFFRQPLHTNL